jgi:hypothetical protein
MTPSRSANMQTERAKAFVKHEPELTAEEVERARSDGKIVVSFKTKPVLASIGDIGFVAVKFVLSDDSPVTILLDRFAGEALWHLLQNVKHLEWKDPCLKPGPAGQ